MTAPLADDLVDVRGWRCTSRRRTVLDLACLLHPEQLKRVVDDELVSGRLTIDQLDALTATEGCGRRGVVLLRRLLDQRRDAPVESELERRFLDLVRRSNLPDPVSQYPASWAGETGPGRVDFAYPDERIAIELDGRRWHSDAAAFESDRRRDQRALLQGWRTIRFTWRQVNQHPDEVVAVLSRLLLNVA